MSYNEVLAARVKSVLKRRKGYMERKMFGGICFMLNGHMTSGVVKDDLMVRVGADGYEAALKLSHARPMDFTGRPLKGIIFVSPKGYATAASLNRWISRAVT